MAEDEVDKKPKHKINWKRVIKRILHFGVDILDEFWPDDNTVTVGGGAPVSIDYDELARALVARTGGLDGSDPGSGPLGTPPAASNPSRADDSGKPGASRKRSKDGKAKAVPTVQGSQAKTDY